MEGMIFSNLPMITWLVGGTAQIQTQATALHLSAPQVEVQGGRQRGKSASGGQKSFEGAQWCLGDPGVQGGATELLLQLLG